MKNLRDPYRPLCAVLLAVLTFVLISGQGGKKELGALMGRSLGLVDAKGRTYATISDDGLGGLAFGIKHPSGAQMVLLVDKDLVQISLHGTQGKSAVLTCSPNVGAGLALQDLPEDDITMTAQRGGTTLGLHAGGKSWIAFPK